jgi:uncharacterized protein YbjT (DUF2867 family)
MDQGMSCVTVFGGTGFVGSRRAPFARVRHQGTHSLAASWAGGRRWHRTDRRRRTCRTFWRPPLPVPTALSMRSVSTLSTEVIRFIRCTWKRPARSQELQGRRGLGGLCTYQASAPMRPRRRYIRSRGEGEAAVQTAFPGAVIVRPAVMFAPDDAFLTAILRLLRSLPAYPIFGDGRTRLQPVHADDVAAAIAQILRQSQKPYPVYELAGPRVYSYEELLRTIARIAGMRPVLMRMPFVLWDALAGLAEMLPRPPLTRNQVELMQIDTTASENLPGFRALGISPRSLEDELDAILSKSKQRVSLP